MPTAFFAQLSLSSNYSATSSSDGWFSYSNSDIDTQDLLSSSKNNMCFDLYYFLPKSVKLDSEPTNNKSNCIYYVLAKILKSFWVFWGFRNRIWPLLASKMKNIEEIMKSLVLYPDQKLKLFWIF